MVNCVICFWCSKQVLCLCNCMARKCLYKSSKNFNSGWIRYISKQVLCLCNCMTDVFTCLIHLIFALRLIVIAEANVTSLINRVDALLIYLMYCLGLEKTSLGNFKDFISFSCFFFFWETNGLWTYGVFIGASCTLSLFESLQYSFLNFFDIILTNQSEIYWFFFFFLKMSDSSKPLKVLWFVDSKHSE